MKQFNVTFRPGDRRLLVRAGATLLEAAASANIILNTACGGKGVCKKCIVHIQPVGGEVLACQYRVGQDLTVTIPPASRFYRQKILERGVPTELELGPAVCKKYLRLDSTDPGELCAALSRAFSNARIEVTLPVYRQLKQFSNVLAGGVTFVACGQADSNDHGDAAGKYTVLGVEAGDTTGRLFGLAVDIGTTTVVAELMNLADGACQGTESAVNPQYKHGDDVISRIAYAQNEAELGELQRAIVGCINDLTAQLCTRAGISTADIYEMCVVGNTTMNHIFLGFSINQLGQAPYIAYSLDAHDVGAERLVVEINPLGSVHTVENIAGFVGADTTAVAVATGMHTAQEMTLAIDIGTNGELVLGTKDRLLAASCAAGPAFEGARISCGSRAVEGAIEAVAVVDGDIDLAVIGGGAPVSICGSGLVDAAAVLLDLGIIDASGRFADREGLGGTLPEGIFSRLTEQGRQPAFVVSAENGVVLTQQDIRQVQLAKAAIRAGLRLLERKLGLKDDDVRYIYLAGAFGNYIRPASAVRIGLLPDVPLERMHFVGNAAGTGARMILLSRRCRSLARKLARSIEYVEIAREKDFADVFADSLFFPRP